MLKSEAHSYHFNIPRAIQAVCIFFLIFMTVNPVTACENPSIPLSGKNNVWYCDTDSDTVIIFVHGVLSDSHGAWSNTPDGPKETYWPEIVRTDPHFGDPAIFLGGYPAGFDGTNSGITNAFEYIRSALIRQINGRRKILDRDNIIFVTHSTGGVVVRYLLLEMQKELRNKRIGLLLVASPSGGSDYAIYLGWLTELVKHEIGKELRWGGLLTNIDTRFKNFVGDDKLPVLEGKELVEGRMITPTTQYWGKWLVELFVGAYVPKIVSKNSAARYFAHPLVLKEYDHISIVKPNGKDHLTHQELQGLYDRVMDRPMPSQGAVAQNQNCELNMPLGEYLKCSG